VIFDDVEHDFAEAARFGVGGVVLFLQVRLADLHEVFVEGDALGWRQFVHTNVFFEFAGGIQVGRGEPFVLEAGERKMPLALVSSIEDMKVNSSCFFFFKNFLQNAARDNFSMIRT
jgi:hypothetical protein